MQEQTSKYMFKLCRPFMEQRVLDDLFGYLYCVALSYAFVPCSTQFSRLPVLHHEPISTGLVPPLF